MNSNDKQMGLQKYLIESATEMFKKQNEQTEISEYFRDQQAIFMKGFFALVAFDVEKAKELFNNRNNIEKAIEVIDELEEEHICKRYFKEISNIPLTIKNSIVISCLRSIEKGLPGVHDQIL